MILAVVDCVASHIQGKNYWENKERLSRDPLIAAAGSLYMKRRSRQQQHTNGALQILFGCRICVCYCPDRVRRHVRNSTAPAALLFHFQLDVHDDEQLSHSGQ